MLHFATAPPISSSVTHRATPIKVFGADEAPSVMLNGLGRGCSSHSTLAVLCRRRPAAPMATSSLGAAAAVHPEHVQLAHELADAAAAVTTRYFRTRVAVDAKSDASPVTIADREAEAAMRALLESRVPDHAVFGEEAGFVAGSGGGDGSSGYLWVVDPIDGTKSFITGARLQKRRGG